MIRVSEFRPEFVNFLPDKLQSGVLYISLPYDTAAHLCACGCANAVYMTLSPTGWKLVRYGEEISLSPSIGNWGFPCQSHYFIRRNKVVWASRWSREEIESGREFDRNEKTQHYAPNARHDPTLVARFFRWLNRYLSRRND